jgi:cell division protein FtsL
MARADRRVNLRDEDNIARRYAFEDGSAVRQLDEEEKRQRVRRSRPAPAVRTGTLGRGFVLFLTAICAAALCICVYYLQQKAEITNQYETIAKLENRYNTLKDDNDARYNEVMSSVSLEDIKEAALTRLGMHYADAGQIRYYSVQDDSYVRQYREVPTDY